MGVLAHIVKISPQIHPVLLSRGSCQAALLAAGWHSRLPYTAPSCWGGREHAAGSMEEGSGALDDSLLQTAPQKNITEETSLLLLPAATQTFTPGQGRHVGSGAGCLEGTFPS